jgi:outer membrane protein assembly factor BamB
MGSISAGAPDGAQAVASAATGAAASTQPLPSSVRWSVPISARPAASPVIAGPRVFLVLQSGVVAAHRLSDGGEAWRIELRTERPVAADGPRVFVASGEAIHALDAETSDVLWRAPIGAVTSPLVAHEGWVVATAAAGITALRAADGSVVWTRTIGAQRERATIEGDNLYVPLEDGRVVALDLQTGAERWSRHFAGAASEVLAFADSLYVGSADRNFYCLDADDGETSWKFWIGATLRGPPAADAVRVFVTSLDNALRAFDRRNGALRWHESIPFRATTGGPSVVGSMVVVSGPAAELLAFEAANGRRGGQIALPAAPVVPPAFAASGAETVVVTAIDSLKGELRLVLTEPPLPQIPVAPLTALPGVVVPVAPPVPGG